VRQVRSRLGSLDWQVIAAIACIVALGVASIYSATAHQAGGPSPLYLKQLAWVGLGLVVLIGVALVDYHALARHAYVGYAAIVVLLVAVLAIGRVGMGAQRWISLGVVDVQPSELAKLVLIVALARYCADKTVKGGLGPSQLGPPLLLALVPIALILMLAAELTGAAPVLLHGCGIALVLARISHALGLAGTAGVSVGRTLGTTATFAVILVLAWVDLAAFLH